MKIAQLITYFYPLHGGAENYCFYLSEQLVEDGHDVHVFTSDRKSGKVIKTREETIKGIKIHRLRVWFRLKYYFVIYPSLLWEFLFEHFDIVHVSGFGFIWHDFVLILKKIFAKNTKFVNTPHGPFMAIDTKSSKRILIKKIFTWIQKLYLNWLYDIVFDDNKMQYKWISSEYKISLSKIKYLPVGMPSDQIDEKISKQSIEKFNKKYQLKGKLVISFLGRLAHYKGIDHLIKAFSIVMKEDEKLHLLLMGREEDFYDEIKLIIDKLDLNNRVIVIENVSEKEKSIGLKISKIFCLPSQWEAFGIVIIEAMAKGNAIISSDTEGGVTLVKPEENGYLFEFGDVFTLTKHLSRLIQYPHIRNKMAQKNLEKVKYFTWQNISKEYLRILKGLLVKDS